MSSVGGEPTTESSVARTPEALVGLVAKGNKNAFSELYDQFSARVMGLVQRVLVDRAQSEEVVQEIFFEVWQTASRYQKSRGGVATWLLTMAHRRAIDRVRSSQSGRDRDLRIGSRSLSTEFDSVAEAGEIVVEHDRVKRALDRLTPLQREAIALAYYGGLTHREIASHLSTPLGTVKTRLRDGMARLRDELGVAS